MATEKVAEKAAARRRDRKVAEKVAAAEVVGKANPGYRGGLLKERRKKSRRA